ncbi:uncharacterized protein LOC18448887 [Amborella trichopoda]|uniref:Senescence regulator S40 n=1 Tax=Amborella trichopoda TaxID=13333 RepID=U5D4D6_AMBTC|nr:uncharacterized protein LOC18448887 [Amborella trichopoda]ERN20471.1 hypothetical protein AMTR_s00068p00151940 [Amborella trichopoda]|eukprot:XP_006859004.1 uncharacterized protein LOC18448887 [Amborella trichopoda]
MDNFEELLEEDVVFSGEKDDQNAPEKTWLPVKKTMGCSQRKMSLPVSIPVKITGSQWKGGFHYGDEEEVEGEGEMVPPHILVERRMAGSCRKTAFSVFDGNGRTLKGRDLRRVRNAVLKQTGFLEGYIF